MQPFMLDGKTILITGASSGIGKGIALACADAGARCVLVARNRERLQETLSLCRGENHIVEIADLSDERSLQELVARLPEVDGLVQCAGVSDNHTPLKFITAEFFDRLVTVNVKAPVLLLAMMDKKKLIRKGGSVVLMSSISSFRAAPAHSLYCLSKGALTAFVKAAALDLAGKKIRVNAIAPGMVNTPMIDFSSITEDQLEADMAKYPLKRYGEPSDIAGAAIYLLSDASSWVTGQQFVIDGGVTIRAG